MKKILILSFMLLFSVPLYAYDIVPKLTLDLPGTFRSDYEVETGIGIGAEARYPINDYFSLGVGLEYLLQRTISDKLNEHYSNKNFSFAPAYVSILFYPFGNFANYKPYLKIDGGYNLAFMIDDAKDSSSGLYVAGAIGFELFEKYIMEITTARYEAKDNGENVTYKKISFKAGYKFTI